MSLVLRSFTALWLAVLLFVVSGVPLHAQRQPYEGPLFWMSGGASPGDYWILPPERAWNSDYTLATSYPDYAVWEWGVGGAPPNDACFGVGVTPITDEDVGPYGLQVVQYFGEYWEGTTFLEHPRPPIGWSNVEFGSFSLTPGPLALPIRALTDTGFPGEGIGNPSACVGRRLAEARGSESETGTGEWVGLLKDADGYPCYSDPKLIRLRSNTELRCEPNLGDRADPMTQRYWPIFDSWPLKPLPQPDGSLIAPIFPSDYAAPYHWARRVEVGMQILHSTDGDEPVQAVFNVPLPGGGSWDDALRARQDVYKGFFPGLLWGVNCDYLDRTFSLSRLVMGMAEPCAMYEQFTAPGSFEPRDTSVLIEDPVQLGSVQPMLQGARGVRQPVPPGAGGFWGEHDRFSLECTWGLAAFTDLVPPAEASVVAWDNRFSMKWAEYLTYPRYTTDPDVIAERDRVYGEAVEAFATREGWETIVVYRTMVRPEMLAALGGAYAVGGGSVNIGAQPIADCPPNHDIRLQALRPVDNSSGTMPGPAGGDAIYILKPENPNTYTTIEQARAPHYWRKSNTGGFRTVFASRVAPGVFAPGSEMPEGVDERLYETLAERLWVQFSCEGVDTGFVAPDIPVFTPGYHDMEAGSLTPGGPELNRGLWFDEAVTNHFGRSYTSAGALIYSAGVFSHMTDVCATAPAGSVTCAAAPAWNTREARRGTYAVDPPVTQADMDKHNMALVTRYNRLTSGDIDPATGEVIMLRDSPERIFHANDYALVGGLSEYVLNVPITLDDGFPEIDMDSSGALAPGQSSMSGVVDYWGVPRGTHTGNPPVQFPDEERLVTTGPVHYRGGMQFTKSGGYGACTLCSGPGCAAGVFEEFPEQRFTSPVTSEGSMVCLIARGLTPPRDCPGR